MSRIPEQVVESVVNDVSRRMQEPTYAQIAIGGFAQHHPDAGRFITAHLDELGGEGEGVMHAVFHAEVLNECFKRHLGRSLAPLSFLDLDEASHGDVLARLKRMQPALADYLASNVETEPMQKLLALIALAMTDIA